MFRDLAPAETYISAATLGKERMRLFLGKIFPAESSAVYILSAEVISKKLAA